MMAVNAAKELENKEGGVIKQDLKDIEKVSHDAIECHRMWAQRDVTKCQSL